MACERGYSTNLMESFLVGALATSSMSSMSDVGLSPSRSLDCFASIYWLVLVFENRRKVVFLRVESEKIDCMMMASFDKT